MFEPVSSYPRLLSLREYFIKMFYALEISKQHKPLMKSATKTHLIFCGVGKTRYVVVQYPSEVPLIRILLSGTGENFFTG